MRKAIFAIAVSMLALHQSAAGQTTATPQATPLPLGIPIVSTVKVTGSDSKAAEFNSNWLPQFRAIINNNLKESVQFTAASGFKLDADRFFLRKASPYPIRVYFLAEGAGYQNAVGFTFTPAGSSVPGTPYLIFPNSSARSGSTRTIDEPLKQGDFVELGHGGNGWQLDFFLLSDGFRKWRQHTNKTNFQSLPNPSITWLWNDLTKNSDRLQHVVAFVLPNSPYVLVGFEDIVGGGDLDYNDVLFVVDIGLENASNLINESTLPQ
ncbi:MAG: DUF4114 domain-containing protein [Pirellula sp.]|jgi:hypothetical protein|nr:DUF4114 domain-containing protein [Pirellula sp.]